MEVIKSRYGLERVIEKLDSTRIRITGESQFQRTSTNDVGETIMFDFEGGPVLSIGGTITFQKSKWNITSILPVESKYEGIVECIIGVKLSY
jgi:hypothetical protein|tara:strand:+ start:255 stop:530 length:276 start_codon:yes stop_codon:yes gene_type:complete